MILQKAQLMERTEMASTEDADNVTWDPEELMRHKGQILNQNILK